MMASNNSDINELDDEYICSLLNECGLDSNLHELTPKSSSVNLNTKAKNRSSISSEQLSPLEAISMESTIVSNRAEAETIVNVDRKNKLDQPLKPLNRSNSGAGPPPAHSRLSNLGRSLTRRFSIKLRVGNLKNQANITETSSHYSKMIIKNGNLEAKLRDQMVTSSRLAHWIRDYELRREQVIESGMRQLTNAFPDSSEETLQKCLILAGGDVDVAVSQCVRLMKKL